MLRNFILAAIVLALLLPGVVRAQTPAPDYRGDFWSRARLTGDWDGWRIRLAEKGVILDLDFVSIPQGVVSGGRDTTFRWGGSSELVLNLNTQKLGLWPGGFFMARAESAFKHGVNANTGSVMPVNTEIVLQLRRETRWCCLTLSLLNFYPSGLALPSESSTPPTAT